MLKFAVIFLCILCYLQQFWSAPIIKASGIQWTEPKGNGRGNLTLIMIPQNNSCNNDTDMLIAVKSDYQVVSQDTQLLNLVINEYQNDSCKESKQQNPLNSFSARSNNNGQVTECPLGDMTPSTNINEFGSCTDKVIQNIKTNSAEVIESGTYETKETRNYVGSGLSGNANVNKYNEPNDSKNISNKDQTANNLNEKGSKIMMNINKNIKSSDSLSDADFMKYLNSVGEVEQHLELDPMKGPNLKGPDSVNFYEAEKKSPVRVNEQSKINDRSLHNINSKNVSAEDVFKFLSAAQLRETTTPSLTNNAFGIFKLLGAAEQSPVTLSRVQEFSTVNIDKLFNSSDNNNNLMSLNSINNRNSNSRVFNDSEINIFKRLNISQPNIENKLKKINVGNVVPQKKDSDRSFLSEVVNIIGKLKQEPNKDDQNLRPDPLISNQAEELVSLDEGDFDTKVKLAKGVYADSAFNDDILKKQLSQINLKQINLNQLHGLKAEGNGVTGNSSGDLTTCYTVFFSEGNTNNGEVKLSNAMSSAEVPTSTPSAGPNSLLPGVSTALPSAEVSTALSSTEVPNVLSSAQVSTALPSADVSTALPSADISTALPSADVSTALSISAVQTALSSGQVSTNLPPAEVPTNLPTTEVPTGSPAAATCRTSIIYLCNEPTAAGAKPQGAMGGAVQKITLEPKIDCESYLKAKKQNQNVNFKEKALVPLIESSMVLANNNEMQKGKDVPILLHNSSLDYGMDILLSGQEGKLARLHANPVDPPVNEEVENIPPRQQIGSERKIEEKITPIKSLNSLNINEQVLQPGQVLKVRFAGKKILMEQMPAYRPEMLEKVCGSTQPSEPVNEEMEPDSKESQVIPGASSGAIPGATTGAVSGASTAVVSGALTGVVSITTTGGVSEATTSAIPGTTTGVVEEASTVGVSGATTGSEQGATTGMVPGATTWAVPGSTTGVVPGATTGVVPGATTGVVPGATTGVVPGASTGVVPEASIEGVSGATTGAEQGATTGVVPGATTGAVPGATTGVVPGATTGVVPGASTGVVPEASIEGVSGATTGAVPGETSGGVPGVTTEVVPGASTGVVTGASIGAIPGANTEASPETQLTINSQSENLEKTLSQTSKPEADTKDKASQTEKKSSTYVTECKVISTSSEAAVINLDNHSTESNQMTGEVGKGIARTEVTVQTTQEEQRNIDNHVTEPNQMTDKVDVVKYIANTEVTVQITQEEKISSKTHIFTRDRLYSEKPHVTHDSSSSGKPHVTISAQKSSSKKHKNKHKQNIKIPGDSVKEIVIQIIRNTKKPKNKQCYVHGKDYLLDDISAQNEEVHRHSLKTFSAEKVKPGEYETELSNEGSGQQENVPFWNPKPVKYKNQIDNLVENDVNPYFVKDNILDNFYVGKDSNEDTIPVIPNSDQRKNGISRGNDENEKAHSYRDLQLADNNVINGF